MESTNALLIKPHVNRWSELRAFLASDWNVFDLDYKIYAAFGPHNFILGNFKKKEDGFKISPGGIFYRDSEEDLEQYRQDLNNGKLEIVKYISLPKTLLKSIKMQGKAYIKTREQISTKVQSIDKYFSDQYFP